MATKIDVENCTISDENWKMEFSVILTATKVWIVNSREGEDRAWGKTVPEEKRAAIAALLAEKLFPDYVAFKNAKQTGDAKIYFPLFTALQDTEHTISMEISKLT